MSTICRHFYFYVDYPLVTTQPIPCRPTSNLVCIKEVAIKTTFCIAGIIYYNCNLVFYIQCTRYKKAFNKRFSRIVCQNNSVKIYSEKILTVCRSNAVYFRLCIDFMHILPPVTAEGFDGFHHPRYAEWSTTAKFNLVLSTMCRNFYFYLIYNKSNRSFQIKCDTRISLCY